jgi:hypothetical protein
MASTRGRQVVVPLTNKSGGAVAAGDVVIVDTGNDAAFTTTTGAQSETSLGVAQETIANNATGRVLIAGYAALVNVPASVTLRPVPDGWDHADRAAMGHHGPDGERRRRDH